MSRAVLLTTLILSSMGSGQNLPLTHEAKSLIIQQWDDTNWVDRFQDIYNYTDAGDPTDTTRSIRFSSDWLQDWRSLVSYDSAGNRIELLRQQGREDEWDDQWRWTYEWYDAGQLYRSTYLTYADGSWDGKTRTVLSYDEGERLADEIVQVNIGDAWTNDTRRLMSYDLDDQLSLVTQQLWNWDDQLWEDTGREQYTHDSLGKQTQMWIQNLDGTEWVNEEQWTWTYDSLGHRQYETYAWWIVDNWIDVDRLVYHVSLEGLVQSMIFQEWDYDETRWFDMAREIYSYDEHKRLTTLVQQDWDEDGSSWENEYRLNWDYPTLSSIDPVEPMSFRLRQNYPNPFNPSTRIRFSLMNPADVELTIYDIRGRKVRSLFGGHRETGIHELQWSGEDDQHQQVSAGVYLCKLTTQGRSQTIKMLLLR